MTAEPIMILGADPLIGASPRSSHAIENARRLSDIGRVRQSLELGPPESIDEHATPGG